MQNTCHTNSKFTHIQTTFSCDQKYLLLFCDRHYLYVLTEQRRQTGRQTGRQSERRGCEVSGGRARCVCVKYLSCQQCVFSPDTEVHSEHTQHFFILDLKITAELKPTANRGASHVAFRSSSSFCTHHEQTLKNAALSVETRYCQAKTGWICIDIKITFVHFIFH